MVSCLDSRMAEYIKTRTGNTGCCARQPMETKQSNRTRSEDGVQRMRRHKRALVTWNKYQTWSLVIDSCRHQICIRTRKGKAATCGKTSDIQEGEDASIAPRFQILLWSAIRSLLLVLIFPIVLIFPELRSMVLIKEVPTSGE
jgi:hypothetical protein